LAGTCRTSTRGSAVCFGVSRSVDCAWARPVICGESNARRHSKAPKRRQYDTTSPQSVAESRFKRQACNQILRLPRLSKRFYEIHHTRSSVSRKLVWRAAAGADRSGFTRWLKYSSCDLAERCYVQVVCANKTHQGFGFPRQAPRRGASRRKRARKLTGARDR